MKKRFIILSFFILGAVLNVYGLSGLTFCEGNSIEQYGITWTFDKKLTKDGSGDSYQYGQYCNGDYWVVGPVNIIDIKPGVKIEGTTVKGNPRVQNGSMILTEITSVSGFDNAEDNYVTYSDTANVGIGISEETPLILPKSRSLLTSISLENHLAQKTSLDTIAVLTCVAVAPSIGAFRPPYMGTDKISYFNISDIDYSILKKHTSPSSTPAWDDVEKTVIRTHIEFLNGWPIEHIIPLRNQSSYGAYLSTEIGIASLMVNMNYSNSIKMKTIVGLIQIGIDYYGVYDPDNFIWVANGGIFSGRKWPILFAGIMLNNDKMKNIGINGAPIVLGVKNAVFHEDGQTFYVTQDDVNMTQQNTNPPDSRDTEYYPYETSDIGMPEWGIRRNYSPELSNKWWNTIYRKCCTAYSWNGYALAALMMNAKALWNHDAFFDYVDRYMAITDGEIDPFGYTVPGEESGWRSSSRFVEDVWDLYRKQY